MISAWTIGFVIGILLAKTGISPVPLNFLQIDTFAVIFVPIAMVSLKRQWGRWQTPKSVAVATGLIWGIIHAAPPYAGPCRSYTVLLASIIPTPRGPAIVDIDGNRFESVVSRGGKTTGNRLQGPGILGSTVIPVSCSRTNVLPTENPVKSFILQRYFRLGGAEKLRGWIDAAVFGSSRHLSFRTIQSFKRTGLVHLLVVSGFNVGLFAVFSTGMLRLPFIILYALTLIRPAVWKFVLTFTEIASVFLALGYVYVIGWPQPSQRAAAFYVIWILGKNVFGVRRSIDRFGWCLFFQTLLFPVGFLSPGNLMSWIATLFLVSRSQNSQESLTEFSKIFDWQLQLKIFCAATALFSDVSFLSLPANLLLAPAIGAILYLTNLNLIFPQTMLSDFTFSVVNAYLLTIDKTSKLTFYFPWLYQKSFSFPDGCRFLFIGSACILVLNSLRELMLRQPEKTQ